MDEALFLRRPLGPAHPAPHPAWPDGFALFPMAEGEHQIIHALLLAAYGDAGTYLPDADDWWAKTRLDAEFSSDLCLVVRDADRRAVAFGMAFTGGFINDLAVHADYRGQGLGEHLLRALLRALEDKGAALARLRCNAADDVGHRRATAERLGFQQE
jgi:ribosomal protein S18 acetylase RimI-like enzyme